MSNQTVLQDLERKEFLDVYVEFDKWLMNLGFRTANLTEYSTYNNYHYSIYDTHIDSLYGVETFVHDTLKLTISFLRDRYEHKFMLVNMNSYSNVMSIEETKNIILNEVLKLRDDLLNKLNSIKYEN